MISYILCCSLLIGACASRHDVSEKEYSAVHIHNNHAFSILAVHTFPGNLSRFVLVRDPHARADYTDKYITPTILNRLQLVNDATRSTGAFWISWSVFLRYFSAITISSYNENHVDERREGQFTRSPTQHVPTYRFYIAELVEVFSCLFFFYSIVHF